MPTVDRVQRLIRSISDYLTRGWMHPSEIGSLAGKLSFTTSATFGRVARAYIRPLYKAEHGGESTIVLDSASTVSRCLRWFREVLPLLPPVTIPRALQVVWCVMYTDAFFDIVTRAAGFG